MGDLGSIPRLGRSPGEGNGNPLQYSYPENPMDRGAWWATVHGVTKSRTWLRDPTFILRNRFTKVNFHLIVLVFFTSSSMMGEECYLFSPVFPYSKAEHVLAISISTMNHIFNFFIFCPHVFVEVHYMLIQCFYYMLTHDTSNIFFCDLFLIDDVYV